MNTHRYTHAHASERASTHVHTDNKYTHAHMLNTYQNL